MQGDMNAPTTFMRTMEDLFHNELGKNIWLYIDKIFVFSDTFEKHIKTLTNTRYYANPKQSVFFARKRQILGQLINDDGIHPAPEKVRTINDGTRPENQIEWLRFNGMVNYIWQFIPPIATVTITAPLTDLSGNAKWLWTNLKEAAFKAVRQAARKNTVLRAIDYNKSEMIWLFTDGSRTGTGAGIGQGPTRDPARPAGFYSTKLTTSQSNYPTHQQETRAIIDTMEVFTPHLLLRQSMVITDYETLTKLMTQKNLNEPQQRWLTDISRFDFKIEYSPVARNFLADYLFTIHEGTSAAFDISRKDPTIDYDNLELPDLTQPLRINTSYASFADFSIESANTLYHSCGAQTSPALTRTEFIHCCCPESLLDEIVSNA